MRSLLVAVLVSMAVTALLTPIVRRIALALGAVDSPTARRVHTRRVPRMGGIAIVAGFFVPLVALYALNTSLAQMLFGNRRLVAGLVVGGLAIAGPGAVDDIVGLGAKRKLLVQTLVAVMAYGAGYRIEALTLPLVGTFH